MIFQVFSVRDIAADAFGVPMFMTSVGGAKRSFADEVNRKDDNNMLHKHPEHFELYHLGTYDDNTALFTMFDRPRQADVGVNVLVRD